MRCYQEDIIGDFSKMRIPSDKKSIKAQNLTQVCDMCDYSIPLVILD